MGLQEDVTKIAFHLFSNGLDAEVKSWTVEPGPGMTITPKQITDALPPEALAKAAERTGVSVQEFTTALAESLPGFMRAAAPHGKVLPDADLDKLFA